MSDKKIGGMMEFNGRVVPCVAEFVDNQLVLHFKNDTNVSNFYHGIYIKCDLPLCFDLKHNK